LCGFCERVGVWGDVAWAVSEGVGAGTKLDRDGSKLDSGDGAKLDFCEILLEVTGRERIQCESQ
jgi:hypothetical protein